MNELLKTLNERASIRQYLDKGISDDTLNKILHATLRAPTAGNMMLYSIIVVKRQETRDTLSKTCDDQPFIAQAPISLIYVADLQRTYDYFEYSKVKEKCAERGLPYQKPSKSSLMLAISDSLIAAQNTVIAAESLGLGTCYIGDIMENYETHKTLLNLPDYVFPIAMLTLGYPAGKKPAPRSRFPQETIVFEEAYKRLDEDVLESMFEPYSQSMDFSKHPIADNYGQHLYFRKFGSEFALEMARSVELMLKAWD